MSEMKKLYICGLQGGGKSLLRQLLDGHPQIFSPGLIMCPGLYLLTDQFLNTFLPKRANYRASEHDYFYRCFREAELEIFHNGQSWILTVGDLWSFLFQNESFNVPIDTRHADWSQLGMDLDSTRKPPADFEFVEFFERATRKLLDVRKFTTIEKLQDLIYQSCIESYKTYPWKYSDDSYFLQLSHLNGIPPIQNICKHNKEKKIIVIRRSFLSSALMNAERLSERTPHFKSKASKIRGDIFGTPFDNALYSRKYMEKYKKFYSDLDVEKENTRDIFEIAFEDMILNTKQTMDNVAKFLGLPADPILYSATINGMPVQHHTGVLDVGTIQHEPNRLLSQKQCDTVEFLFAGWKKEIGVLRNLSSLLRVSIAWGMGTAVFALVRNLAKRILPALGLRGER